MSLSEGRKVFRAAVLSVVKHDYLPRAVASHPRMKVVVVADDGDRPDWVHQRNQLFADELGVPYVRDVERAIADHDVQVAVVGSETERHCDLSVRAVNAGLHVVQDKPMSNRIAECDRLVDAVERRRVKFLMWNRNFMPALLQAREAVEGGAVGRLQAIHVDFYFAKDAGPLKGSRRAGDPPINWLERQIEAHADGSDGGVGQDPMGELEVQGIYALAYLSMLTGARVQEVFALTTAHFHQAHFDNDVDDLASVSLRMEGGLVGTLCLGRIGAASHPELGPINLHLMGTEGALVISEPLPQAAIHYRDQPPEEYRLQRIANENDFLLVEDFVRAIDTDGTTILDVRNSRAICATVLAAIKSGRCRNPVRVEHRE